MRARAFSLFVAVVAAVGLVSVSGAASAKVQRGAAIDVLTRASVVRYLRSIHVNPRGVVVQRGARNYAGSGCPGKGWSCTSTAHPVVQVASGGGRNRFVCSTARCAVVQVSAGAAAGPASAVTNTAKCVKTGSMSATQTCSITQSSSTNDNLAVVFESIQPGYLKSGTSKATITQTAGGASNGNTACVTQNIKLVGSGKGTPFVAKLNAHQTVNIFQDATGSGANSAQYGATSTGTCDLAHPLAQHQTLKSTATSTGGITQNENATGSGANMTIDIEQNQGAGLNTATGTNNATFVQLNTLIAIANSTHGPVSQTQSSPDGGLLGTINQDSTGVSTANATQTEIQCEDAAKSGLKQCDTSDLDASEAPASLTQTQFGPVHKGVGTSTQLGNANDTFTINQTSTQNNDTGAGQTNVVQGDCSTSGNCTVTQNTNIDGQTNTNTVSGQDINTTTTCIGDQCSGAGPGSIPVSVSNTDVREFGYGGMRGIGTGSITVTGITGPVTQAFLYWNGPTNSSDPSSNASVMFNGKAIVGTNIGTSGSNCWGYTNSQSYRAGVTSLVSKGNGVYSLSDFLKTGDGTIADINGVALFVFYNDGNSSNNRNVVIWNGNDSNAQYGNDPDGWDETLHGVPYPGGGSASLDFVVADGQSFTDGALSVNGTQIVPQGSIFQGDSTPVGAAADGGLWDVKSFTLPSNLLTTGSNTLEVTSPAVGDCLSLVAVAANMPASAPVG